MICNVTIAMIDSFLEDPLDHLECDAFTEDDQKLIQLVVTLFRNSLIIQNILLHHKDADLNVATSVNSLKLMMEEENKESGKLIFF